MYIASRAHALTVTLLLETDHPAMPSFFMLLNIFSFIYNMLKTFFSLELVLARGLIILTVK